MLPRLPETKNLTLEELDTVFNVGNREHARYYQEKLPWYAQKYIMCKDVVPMEPLYQFADDGAGGLHVAEKERKTFDEEKGRPVA